MPCPEWLSQHFIEKYKFSHTEAMPGTSMGGPNLLPWNLVRPKRKHWRFQIASFLQDHAEIATPPLPFQMLSLGHGVIAARACPQVLYN